jgi:mono/diheme cytochrome c family protein
MRPSLLILLATLLPLEGLAAPQAFLERHCHDCHDADSKKGNLDLTSLGFGAENADVWIKIHDAVERGEMPPRKKKRPEREAKTAFLSELDAQLTAATSTAETGRVRLRRMTRKEFENTLCDLLALPKLDVTGLLPADGRVAGYDKIGSGLDLSPGHLVAYQEAVEKALDAAIATRSTPPPVFQKRVYPAGLFKFGGNLIHGQFVLLKDKLPDPALPVRGGFEDKTGHVGHDGPDIEERRNLVKGAGVAESQSAVGLLNPNLAGYEAALNVSPIYAGMYRLKISLWGFHWDQGKPVPCTTPQAAVLRAHEEGKQQEGGRLLRTLTAPSMRSNEVEFTAFLKEHESIVFDPVSVPWIGLRIGQIAGRAARHVGPGVAIDWFEIEGPLNATWPPESHKRLFGNLPVTTLPGEGDVVPPRREVVRSIGGYVPILQKDIPLQDRKPTLETVQSAQPEEDARMLLSSFLPRAFRRDVTHAEIEPYVALLKSRLLAKDCFEDAMRRVYVAVLTSPEFLFHPADAKKGRGLFSEKDSYTLASRLSYWLWNGPPDEELLAKARDESLNRPEIIREQIDRLLADARSDRFIDDFTDQWLELGRLDETTPDPQLYPEYRFLLHEGMAAETRAFVRTLLSENLPISSLLEPGFAMLTQRLAEHYGIQGVHGVNVRKVLWTHNESVRGGLLGQAAIHKLTANGTTTSPVKRGVWVMDRLLNAPAPPPPPGISLIDPDTRGTTTVREQLDRHRSDANCAACHAKIDPPGFALEAFDPIGGLRERYRSNGTGDEPPEKGKTTWKIQYKLGPKVDATGALADGRPFQNVSSLNRLLAGEPERLAAAFVAHLSRYATGTEVGYADRAEIRRIVESTRAGGYRMRALVHGLGTSRLIQPEIGEHP